jgi:hypothetical protein
MGSCFWTNHCRFEGLSAETKGHFEQEGDFATDFTNTKLVDGFQLYQQKSNELSLRYHHGFLRTRAASKWKMRRGTVLTGERFGVFACKE